MMMYLSASGRLVGVPAAHPSMKNLAVLETTATVSAPQTLIVSVIKLFLDIVNPYSLKL